MELKELFRKEKKVVSFFSSKKFQRKVLKWKLKACELFGARAFQKIVYTAEDLKYYILRKYPKLISIMEDVLDRGAKREKKKVHSNVTKEQIDVKNKINKILFHKEIQRKQNRNYHFAIDPNTNFSEYLLWNRKVHIHNLRHNIGFLIGASVLLLSPFSFLYGAAKVVIVINTICGIVNLECINLQNYHLLRYHSAEKRCERIRVEAQEEAQEKYGDAMNAIAKVIVKEERLPSLIDVARQMNANELIQLREILLSIQQKEQESLINERKR